MKYHTDEMEFVDVSQVEGWKPDSKAESLFAFVFMVGAVVAIAAFFLVVS